MGQILGNYHITQVYYDEISANMLATIILLGCCLAGDENLLHFTGDSIYIRKVVDKPDRIGFCFSQLCGLLLGGFAYMINIKLHNSNQQEGIRIAVDEIVSRWADVMDGDDDT